MGSFLVYNIFYLASAVPLSLVTYIIFRFYYKNKTWYTHDIVGLASPGTVYFFLSFLGVFCFFGKTLSNMFEPLFIGVGAAVVFFIRALLAKRHPDKAEKYSELASLSTIILTVIVYVFFPSLTE